MVADATDFCMSGSTDLTLAFGTPGVNETGTFNIEVNDSNGDPAVGIVFIEDITMPGTINLNNPIDVNPGVLRVVFGANMTCSPITYTITATAECSDNSSISVTPMTETITVYPTALTTNITDDGSSCGTPTVQLVAANNDVCATQTGTACSTNGDMFTTSFATATDAGSGYDGSLFAAAPAACVLPADVTITCAGCAVACPTITVTDDAATICSGDLATEITDWEDALELANAAALGDNADAVVTYTGATTNSNPTGCNNLVEMVVATINCFGDDGVDDSGANDDMTLTLGTFTLTTTPDAQQPVNGIVDCTNTPAVACPTDVLGTTATNATGGASTANWDGTTYTAQPGDLAGTIDVDVTTAGNCTGTFTITTPACPALPVCMITSAVISNVVCNNNGTDDNPADDTYTFDLDVTAMNASGTFNWDDGTTTGSASYGTTVSFGPYPISGGNITVDVEDSIDAAACADSATATAPASCSICECDNGTLVPGGN